MCLRLKKNLVLKLLDRTVYSDHWAVKGQVLLDIIIAVKGIMKGSLCTFTYSW